MSNRFLQIWISLMHIGAYVFFYLYSFESKWISYAGQVLVVVSFFLIVLAYSRFVRRMQPFQLGIGLLRNHDFSTKLVKTGNKHVDQAIELFNSMLEQLKKEKTERAEQEQFMNLLIDASPLGVVVLGFDKRITSVNAAALGMLQMEKEHVIGEELNGLKSEVGKELASLKLNEMKLVRLQMQQQYRLTKGSMIDRGHERFFYIIEELTADIQRAEKNAWEKLIQVMAHEVNNTVGAVNSIMASLKEVFQNDDEKEILTVAQNRNESLTKFINQYATIVKLEQPQKHELSIWDLCNTASSLLKPSFDAQQINFHLVGSDDFKIKGDQAQLEQVIHNILQNAIDSFNSYVSLDRHITIQINSVEKELTLSNNGNPISEEVKPYLFSPFFTTKTNGNGIGLMLTSEVLQMHNCKFSLATIQDETVFKIKFPKS